mgnify:FL=1
MATSPTPWAVIQDDYGNCGIASADGGWVIEEVATTIEDAELIVLAVNNHKGTE